MRSDRSLRGCWLVGGLLPCGTVSGAGCAPCSPCPKAEWGHSGMQLLPGLWRECPREGAQGAPLRLRGLGPPGSPVLQMAPAAHLTTGLSCLEPAFRALVWPARAMPWNAPICLPQEPGGCPLAQGLATAWEPLAQHPCLSNDELDRVRGRVRTQRAARSRPRPMGGETEAQRDKGRPGGGTQWSPVVFPVG